MPESESYSNRVAIKCPEMRQKAYKSFCDHLALGKSIKSWWFEDGDVLCCWATMLSYIDKNPLQFDPIKKRVAEIKGFQKWEEITELSAQGLNKAVTPSLQMVMRNKYGWDKVEKEKKISGNTAQDIIDVANGED